MIILRQKSFANFASLKHPHGRTQYREDQKSPVDANIMTNLGRTGLVVTSALGGAGLVEGVSGLMYVNGRSLQNPNTNNGILTT